MQLGKQKSLVFKYAVKSMLAVTMLFAILALSPTAMAQVLYGSITGTVTDATGAVEPNAHVTALEVSKGVSKDAISDAYGIYRITDLIPGTYQVAVAAPNFATQTTGGLVVDSNSIVRLDAKLSPHAATESVTVTAAPPELQTDRADIHSDLSAVEVQSLPSVSSEGKSFQQLLRIIPGANLPAENNSAASNPSRAMTSNVNGQSSQGNSTRIDGVLDLDPWLPNNIAYVPPTAAVDTVNIATNSFDAEQGMVNGAMVNVIIKSGSNQFHGEAHEFHTDDGMKNKTYFNAPGYKKALNVFNQFGGSVGGPIFKNKLFFFGDWEENRQVQSPSGGNPQTVPTGPLMYSTAAAAGYFNFAGLMGNDKVTGNPIHIYDPLTGNADGTGRSIFTCNGVQDAICVSRLDSASKILAAMLPAPSPGLTTVSTNNYLDLQKGFFNRDDYDAKINYVPSDKTTYFGHYSMTRATIFDPPALDNPNGNIGGAATNGGQQGYSYPHIYVIGLGLTHAFTPNLLLDANGGYTRQNITAENIDITQFGDYGLDTLKIPGTNDAGLPAPNQLYWGIPEFEFGTGYSSFGNTAGSNPFQFRDNQLSGSANLTWVKGHHSLRFGVEDDHTGLNHFQPQGSGCETARGCFDFTGVATEAVTLSGGKYSNFNSLPTGQYNDYADFLLGLPEQTGKTIITSDPIALRWSQYAFYARDQYQVLPSLSLDLGIRYEYYPTPYSDHGYGVRELDLNNMNVYIGGHGTVPVNDNINAGHGEFLPRVGVAWRPDSKTVIRSGFGLGGDSNNWRFMRNDYPANISTAWSGVGNGAATPACAATTCPASSFTPAASLTGANNTGPFPGINLPTGLVLATVPNISTGVVPLPAGISTTNVPLNFRRGYIIGYNLAVEREFAGFVADLSYVGEQGIRPLTEVYSNWSPIGSNTSTDRVLNAQFGVNWPDENEIVPTGRSHYDSMQAKLTRNFGHASTVGVVETWAKVIDFTDNEEIGGDISWNEPSLFSKNYGLASYNRKSNFEGYWVYKLPFGTGEKWATNGIANWLAGGWQFSGVISILTGTPFSVVDSGDTANLSAADQIAVPNQIAPVTYSKGRPDESPGNCAVGTASCSWFSTASFQRVGGGLPASQLLGNVGRDQFIGPGYFDLDGSLKRDIKIQERLTFEIEGDAFGLTNTPHFGNPTADLNSSNFGKVTSEITTANASLGGSGGEREFFVEGKFIF